MHVSLDSALGRQRRLNSVGESVLQIAPSAAAAYSLRSLTGGDPKVVRVRRVIDNGESDFTASGISSGALVDFVNAIQTVGTAVNGTGSFDNYTVTGASTTGFSADNSAGGVGMAGFPYVFKNEDVIVVKYTVTNFSSTSSLSPVLRGVRALDVITAKTNDGNAITSNGTYTDTLTAIADGTHLMFADGDTGSYTISNFEIVSHSSSGFVDTWYDQSGNSNDAVQATAGSQPKIVSSGSLVTDANGHPELDFSSDFLSKTAFTQGDLEQPNTTFTVAKLNTNDDSNKKLYDGTVGAKRNMLFLGTVGSGQFGLYSQVIIYTGETATNDKHLFSGLHNGASSELFINSASKASGNTGPYAMSGINIAKNHSGETNFWSGQIQELIVYNSNQSSNRVAIETNINSHYSIF